ncbi:STAS domain-containing protein [Streptomyces sp. NPDC059740]|uniref:STAS domain-containing protein n=1 Tax=Streptomyces sp. NPDC059740 TaxID=3346926 RepID=UPI00364EB4CE
MLPTFDVTVREPRRDPVELTVTGELDLDTARHVRRAAAEVLTGGRTHLRVDVAGVTFCDSSGLSAFLDVHRWAREAGGSLTLTEVPGRLRRLLVLTGLEALLTRGPAARSDAPAPSA